MEIGALRFGLVAEQRLSGILVRHGAVTVVSITPLISERRKRAVQWFSTFRGY